MATYASNPEVLKAAQLWRDRCLLRSGSVFTEEPLWTRDTALELRDTFHARIDEGEGTFTEKLATQLAELPAPAKRLTAEMLWLLWLFPTNVKQPYKVDDISRVWAWSGAVLPSDHPLLKPLERGIGSAGQGFLIHRWAELAFVMRTTVSWLELPRVGQDNALSDGWQFAGWLDAVDGADGRQFRHMLLHMLFPSDFERIASARDKHKIDEALRGWITGSPAPPAHGWLAVDYRLRQIREAAELRFATQKLDFYETPLAELWSREQAPEVPAENVPATFEQILQDYRAARREPFGSEHPMYHKFRQLGAALADNPGVKATPSFLVKASAGQGNWAKVPWVAILDTRETRSIQAGVYCVYLFREDMTGCYLTLNQGVTKLINDRGVLEGRKELRRRADAIRPTCAPLLDAGFTLDNTIDLRVRGGLGADYEHSTIAHKFYQKGQVPSQEELTSDLQALLDVYDTYVSHDVDQPEEIEDPNGLSDPVVATAEFDRTAALDALSQDILAAGFVFEPWQVAQFVTAVRTKPFVILAGVSGTGKSKLPSLVARATGAESRLIPVRPDWTDSAEVIGYNDLQSVFRPGALLQLAYTAESQSDREWFCIIDEMNLAHVEQYFAEVLSRIEDRRPVSGGFATGPLLGFSVGGEDVDWSAVTLPANMAIVGTVNMDETTHGFSRKVLDRAFTIELSDVDLSQWGKTTGGAGERITWPTQAWSPRAITLAALTNLSAAERLLVDNTIAVLEEINGSLVHSQLQVGYRTRDEMALFRLHASDVQDTFATRAGDLVDPLDLVIHMKVLPRIVGGSGSVRRTVLELLSWSISGTRSATEGDARSFLTEWESANRPGTIPHARFPHTAARLCLMWERLIGEGYTSFWL